MAIAGTATAQRASASHVLQAVVPSIVRVEVVAGQVGPDGYPLVRVVTNDPAIRARMALGVPREELSSPVVRSSGVTHAKGGEAALEGGVQVGPGVIRYTIAQP